MQIILCVFVQCVTVMKSAVFLLIVPTTVCVSVNAEVPAVAVIPAYLDSPGEGLDRAAQVSCCYVPPMMLVLIMQLDDIILNPIMLSEKTCDEETLKCQNGGTCINFQRCTCPDGFTGNTPGWN